MVLNGTCLVAILVSDVKLKFSKNMNFSVTWLGKDAECLWQHLSTWCEKYKH